MAVALSSEGGCGVFAQHALDVAGATGVLLDEIRHINHIPVDDDPLVVPLGGQFSHFRFGVLRQDGRVGPPVDASHGFLQVLVLHLQCALGDLVGAEALQLVCNASHLQGADEPLGGVVVEPADPVAVVGWELVVEVVVALADGQQCRDDAVSCGLAVGVRGVAGVVGNRVHTERGVVDEEETEAASNEEATIRIAPQRCNHTGQQEAEEQSEGAVVLVLDVNDRLGFEVLNVGVADAPRLLLAKHPATVCVPETLAGGVGVLRQRWSEGVKRRDASDYCLVPFQCQRNDGAHGDHETTISHFLPQHQSPYRLAPTRTMAALYMPGARKNDGTLQERKMRI